MPEMVGGTSFLAVPAGVVEALGSGKRPKVAVTLNGYTYRTTISVYGGQSYVPVRREIREASRITPCQPTDVAIELDTAPRVVEVPDDLAAALDAEAPLRQAFDQLSYSHRKEYVDWITGAKRHETRRQRIEKAASMLRQGVRTPKG
jgi:hypothetical protein